MKKLYFFLLMALTFSLGVNAATHKFTLNIEDASKVIVERLNSDKVVEETYNIQNGENSISIEVESFFNTYTLRVTPVEGYILKAFNKMAQSTTMP